VKLAIQLLGRFGVRVDDREIPASEWRRDRAAALIKLLAITPQHRMHREQVMEAFWPDLDVELAAANFRKAIHFARKVLGVHDLITVSKEIVALADHVELQIDAEQFDAAAKAALRSTDAGECAHAADLYGGDLLPDDRYVEWLDTPRHQLQLRYTAVLRAGRLWQHLIALDPTDEEAQCALMQAALDAGNRNDAIRQFDQLRERLHIELGVGPTAAAIGIYERALSLSGVEPATSTERIRASLAWGLVHLQSGDFGKASEIARETRSQALAADLPREVGEASAVLGLAAQMQGHWRELFRSEFTEWVRTKPGFVPAVFNGHLCLAEFCLCTATGHADAAEAARELLAVSEQAKSAAGRGLACLILGEVAMFAGRLDEAETLLMQAEQLLVEADATSGRVLALERQAEIALERGQKWRASRLIRRGLADAEQSWLSPHLVMRMQALEVRAAPTKEKVAEAIVAGDRLLSTPGACQPCSMALRTATAVALAEAGDLAQVDRRLNDAERIAGMWHGGPWAAALWEARGVQRQAQQNSVRAMAAFTEAAARYEELGRPLDQARCLNRMAASMPQAKSA
jgi:DNA-binding SARP family transcriptional activator